MGKVKASRAKEAASTGNESAAKATEVASKDMGQPLSKKLASEEGQRNIHRFRSEEGWRILWTLTAA